MVLEQFFDPKNMFDILPSYFYTITFQEVSLFKSITAEKSSPLLWNVLEKIFDSENKSPPDGALLEVKKERRTL